MLSRGNSELTLEALVVNNLDVDILAGIPFLFANDVSVRPAKQQIIIGGADIIYYGPMRQESPDNRVRRTQAFVLRATIPSTVVWPGSYIQVETPLEMNPNEIVAIEPRYDQGKALYNWPSSQIIKAVCGKLRILNDTSEPQTIHKHEHFCQVRHTTELIYNVSTSENCFVKNASKSLTTA